MIHTTPVAHNRLTIRLPLYVLLSTSSFQCVAGSCTAPADIEKASTPSCKQGSTINSGAICTPSCSSGYAADVQTLSCNAGTLTPGAFKCEPIPCTAPSGVPRTKVPACKEGFNFKHSETCSPVCIDRFSSDKLTLTCTYGDWIPSTFNCVPARCEAPVVSQGTDDPTCTQGSMINHASFCTPKCMKGWSANQTKLTCTLGHLSPTVFGCSKNPDEIADCSPFFPDAESKGQSCKEGWVIAHDAFCTTSCPEGFMPDKEQLKCSDGDFSPEPKFECLKPWQITKVIEVPENLAGSVSSKSEIRERIKALRKYTVAQAQPGGSTILAKTEHGMIRARAMTLESLITEGSNMQGGGQEGSVYLPSMAPMQGIDNAQDLSQRMEITMATLSVDPFGTAQLGSSVVEVDVWDSNSNVQVSSLESMITIMLPIVLPEATHHTCVWWNTTTSSWDDSGCVFTGVVDTYVACNCSHLTAFSTIGKIVPNCLYVHSSTLLNNIKFHSFRGGPVWYFQVCVYVLLALGFYSAVQGDRHAALNSQLGETPSQQQEEKPSLKRFGESLQGLAKRKGCGCRKETWQLFTRIHPVLSIALAQSNTNWNTSRRLRASSLASNILGVQMMIGMCLMEWFCLGDCVSCSDTPLTWMATFGASLGSVLVAASVTRSLTHMVATTAQYHCVIGTHSFDPFWDVFVGFLLCWTVFSFLFVILFLATVTGPDQEKWWWSALVSLFFYLAWWPLFRFAFVFHAHKEETGIVSGGVVIRGGHPSIISKLQDSYEDAGRGKGIIIWLTLRFLAAQERPSSELKRGASSASGGRRSMIQRKTLNTSASTLGAPTPVQNGNGVINVQIPDAKETDGSAARPGKTRRSVKQGVENGLVPAETPLQAQQSYIPANQSSSKSRKSLNRGVESDPAVQSPSVGTIKVKGPKRRGSATNAPRKSLSTSSLPGGGGDVLTIPQRTPLATGTRGPLAKSPLPKSPRGESPPSSDDDRGGGRLAFRPEVSNYHFEAPPQSSDEDSAGTPNSGRSVKSTASRATNASRVSRKDKNDDLLPVADRGDNGREGPDRRQSQKAPRKSVSREAGTSSRKSVTGDGTSSRKSVAGQSKRKSTAGTASQKSTAGTASQKRKSKLAKAKTGDVIDDTE